MNVRKVLVVAGAAAAVLVGTTASPASAVTNYREYASIAGSSPPSGSSCSQVSYGGSLAGVACYQALGDVFWIRDTAADGHHVEARGVMEGVGRGFSCYSYRGSDVGWEKCTGFADLIPEHDTINLFRSELYEGDTLLAGGLILSVRTT